MKVRVLSVACIVAILLFAPRPSAAQWVDLGGPGECGIQALAANGSYLYAGTAFGVFVSTDEGETWNRAGEIYAPSFRAASELQLLALGRELFALKSGGVFRSIDNGGSWVSLNSGLPEHPDALCLLQARSSLYCGLRDGGIYKSADRGGHWMSAGTGLPEDFAVSNLASQGDVLYAGFNYDKWIYRSMDGGATWAPMTPPLPEDERVESMVVDGSRLFVLTSYHGIFAIQEGGEAWTRIGTAWGAPTKLEFLAQSGRALLAGNEDGLARLSMDGGVTWTEIEIDIEASRFTAAFTGFAMVGSRLFVGSGGRGLLRSEDLGLTWTKVNAGLPSQADVVSLARMGTDLFLASRDWDGSGGIYLRTEGGAGWEPIALEFPDKPEVHCLATIGTNLVAGTDCGLFLSEDRGRSWSSVGPVRAKNSKSQYSEDVGGKSYPRVLELNVSFVKVAKARLFAGTAGGLFMSADHGRTWSKVLSRESGPALVDCFAGAGSVLFAAGPMGLYISRDSGETWDPVTTGLSKDISFESLATDGRILVAGVYLNKSISKSPQKPVDADVDSVAVLGIDVQDGLDIDLYQAMTILLSEDEGRSWKAGAEGLPDKFRVALIKASGAGLFVALTNTYTKLELYSLGFFLSKDRGKTWMKDWPGQWLATVINDLLVEKDAIYIATEGAGVWRLPLSALK